ncbi:MAG: TerB family tellurite resistance protein [Phycisphaerales bacterium]|nr:TerB family tellurite resistance protein [Phycisphaerales bacterium]
MTPQQRDAVATLCVMAAFADGASDAEREQIRQILSNLSPEAGGTPPATLYQRVLLNQTRLEDEASRLDSPQTRQLAYEMAACVCSADGATSAQERAFLGRLQSALGLGDQQAAPVLRQADELASVKGDEPGAGPALDTARAAAEAESDASVLRYAILTGALELLPQGLATMAIIPLQTKMVYGVGRRFGYALDAGHIKEFIGVVGVGMTGQVLENFARRLLGGFARAAGGRMLGGLASAAAGPVTTFATTYALGMVAKQYYAGGRTLSAVDLKSLFSTQFERAKGLYSQHAGAVQQQAGTLDAGKVLQMVRGA